jgi:predicted DNA binding CopG/RHH family protein
MKASKKTKKKELVDVTKEELDFSKSKQRVTIWLNFPALSEIRREAEGKSIPYQSLINQILMDYANKEKVDKLIEIENRVRLLEAKVS